MNSIRQPVNNPPTDSDISRFSSNIQSIERFVNGGVPEILTLPGGGRSPNLAWITGRAAQWFSTKAAADAALPLLQDGHWIEVNSDESQAPLPGGSHPTVRYQVKNGVLAEPLNVSFTGRQNIGSALYPQSAAEITAGVMPVDFGYPIGNVKRYGAIGDGVRDDTSAINTAIRVLNPWTAASGGNNSERDPAWRRGGTVVLPAGTYLITSPILLAPNITLRGATPVKQNLGFATSGYSQDQLPTTIVARFPAGKNWYLIDTGNWRFIYEGKKTPVASPYRVIDAVDIFGGQDKDNSVGSSCAGCCLFDLVLKGEFSAIGGIRMQMWYYGIIDRVVVVDCNAVAVATYGSFEFTLGQIGNQNQPVGVAVILCESATQGGSGEINSYNILPKNNTWWSAENQSVIDEIFYAHTDSGKQSPWYQLTTKAVLVVWSLNCTFNTLGPNNCNVAVHVVSSQVNILHMEHEHLSSAAANEVTFCVEGALLVVQGLTSKSRAPLSTGKKGRLLIHGVFGITNPTTFVPFSGESSSNFEVDLYDYTNPGVIGNNCIPSTLNVTKIFNPVLYNASGTSGGPFSGAVTLYCSPSGNPTYAGTHSDHPTTVDGALAFVANNPHILQWDLRLKDDGVHTISVPHILRKSKIAFIREGGGKGAAILSVTESPILDDCHIVLVQGIVLSNWTTNSAFQVSGRLLLDLGADVDSYNQGGISIPAGKALVSPTVKNTGSCEVTMVSNNAAITFGVGSGLASGNVLWKDHASMYKVQGTPSAEALSKGSVVVLSSRLVSQGGWGSPVGAAVQRSFDASSATLLQTNAAVASIINALKEAGILRT